MTIRRITSQTISRASPRRGRQWKRGEEQGSDEANGWTDEQTDGRTNKRTDEQTDGRTDEQTDGRMDGQTGKHQKGRPVRDGREDGRARVGGAGGRIDGRATGGWAVQMDGKNSTTTSRIQMDVDQFRII